MDGSKIEGRPTRVAVVIVAWNSLAYLRACLLSIFEPAWPTAPDFPPDSPPIPPAEVEVFVVDNGSTDGSPDMVAREFPAVRLIRESANRGYPAANNIALRTILAERRSEVVVLLNSDVAVVDRAIDRLAAYLGENRGVAAVLPALILPDGRFQIGACGFLPTARTLFDYFFGLHKVFPVRSRSFFIDQKAVAKRVPFLRVEWLSGACATLRRETIERVGLMSEDYFFYAEDLDWGRRMKNAGLTLHYFPGARVIHHHGVTYQDVFRETNTAWLRMVFKYLRAERSRAEYVLGRSFAAAGFLLRTVAHSVRAFPWTRTSARRKIREVFRFFTFSLTGK